MRNIIQLRALEMEDIDFLYDIENDMEMWKEGISNVPYSRYALSNYIATNSNDIYIDKQLRLVIENLQGDVLGLIDLTNFNPGNRRAEVGIVVKNNERQKGYATAAIYQFIDYCKNIIHLHQLYACVSANNIASMRLFKRIGFSQCGKVKDWIFYNGQYTDAFMLQYIIDK